MTLLSHTKNAVRVSDFLARGVHVLWKQLLLLLCLTISQQALALWSARGGDGATLEAISSFLLVVAFAVLAWLGHDAVAVARGTTLTAIAAGFLYFPLIGAIGFCLFALLGGTLPPIDRIALSIISSALLGGVFAGTGGMVARVKSRFWLKH